MELAFGLTNSSLTGGDRTGSLANFSSDNTFDTVEFNYFPNVSSEFGGPTLTPSVFGGQDGDAFSNFASIFGDASNLGTHASGITGLANGTEYQAQLAYDGTTQLMTLTMYQVTAAGPVLLDTGLIQLDFGTSGPVMTPAIRLKSTRSRSWLTMTASPPPTNRRSWRTSPIKASAW